MAATIIAGRAHSIKGYHYINCDFLLPDSAHNAGQQIQMPVSHNCIYHHNISCLLDLRLAQDTPHTLADIGITAAAAQRARSALAAIWEHADAQGAFCAPITTMHKQSGDVQPGSTPQLRLSVDCTQTPGPFTDDQLN
eukprot:344483-Rhodomonas_salina.1